MNKIEELRARIRSDYQEVIQPFLKQEPRNIIRQAYELAHYNTIAEMFESVEEGNGWFNDTVIDNIINYQGNIFTKIYRLLCSSDMRPEFYNFFELKDFIFIVNYAFLIE